MSYITASRQITIAEMAPHVHSFGIGENKVQKISDWLAGWIKSSLATGKIKPYDYLPSKGALAFHIGVSKGTIQNSFRILEDVGLIESKQKKGSYIKDPKSEVLIKLTSKREFAASEIKLYIKKSKLKIGNKLDSLNKLSRAINLPATTIRIAINTLIADGILERTGKVFVIKNLNFDTQISNKKTLTEKIADRIKEYIKKGGNTYTKLPSNPELAKKYKVSIKTVHDAVKILEKEGLVSAKRGRYGTTVLTEESATERYEYEIIENKIREYMIKNCEIGSKLPSIKIFAEEYNVSTKTVKRAMDNLAEDGYLTFIRGRYGGTFATDIPQTAEQAYTWLALNPEYVSETPNQNN